MATSIVWPFADVSWQIGPFSYARATQYAEIRTRRGRQILRIGTNGSSTVNLSVVLSDLQLADFDGWVQHTLAGGGKWFRAPVRLSGIRQERELRLLNIGEPVQAIGLSGKWTVPCTAETRVGSEMDYETYTASQEYGGIAAYGAFIGAFNIFAEQEMPAPTFKEEA